jgi:capsular exopolysaccharide synthesis family protein
MSQIFDALHQSQDERAGANPRKFVTAKELLQAVEQGTEIPAESVSNVTQPNSREPRRQFPAAKLALQLNTKLVCFSPTESLAAEKFRFLATRLRHIQQKRPLKCMVITSSVPDEGKTMVAANLACALARGKQNVLLMEGDLRRPTLGRALGLCEHPGLSQLLQHQPDSVANIYSLEIPGLCVLLAGSAHTNPYEFMEPAKLSSLIERVSQLFDWIVVDSPPLLPLADTSMWVRLAEAVILVARPGVTTKRQLQKTLEAIEQPKLLGAVLNASTEATTNTYYYHYTLRSNASSPKIAVAK